MYILSPQDLTDLNTVMQFVTPVTTPVVQVGSSVLPFINSYHDIDLVFATPTQPITRENHVIIRRVFSNTNINLFCGRSSLLTLDEDIYFYQRPYMKVVYGEYIIQLPNLQDYNELRKSLLQHLDLLQRPALRKRLYHTYAALKTIQNQQYQFTDEQIDIINQLHDNHQALNFGYEDHPLHYLYKECLIELWSILAAHGESLDLVTNPQVREFLENQFPN